MHISASDVVHLGGTGESIRDVKVQRCIVFVVVDDVVYFLVLIFCRCAVVVGSSLACGVMKYVIHHLSFWSSQDVNIRLNCVQRCWLPSKVGGGMQGLQYCNG